MAQHNEVQKPSTGAIVLKVMFTLCLLGSVVFIFSNSSQIGSASGLRSQQATALINAGIAKLGLGFALTEHAVRKLGHFGEFMLLGLWMTLTLRVYTRRILAFLAWPLFFGLAVAVLDELYQRFVPGRSSDVLDVCIDFCGVLGGMAFALAVLLIFGGLLRIFEKRKERGQAEN